jgi:hypothetical protein
LRSPRALVSRFSASNDEAAPPARRSHFRDKPLKYTARFWTSSRSRWISRFPGSRPPPQEQLDPAIEPALSSAFRFQLVAGCSSERDQGAGKAIEEERGKTAQAVEASQAYANDNFLVPKYKLLATQEVTSEAESAE